MSNERFDKFFRKNLEAVRPAYNPAAWERFQKRLPVSPLASWLLTYGGWVVSSALLCGWLVTFYLYRKQQNTLETVQHQINTLIEDNSLRSQKPATNRQAPISESNRRVDTVYVIRKLIIDSGDNAYANTLPASTRPAAVKQSTEVQHNEIQTGIPGSQLPLHTGNSRASATGRKQVPLVNTTALARTPQLQLPTETQPVTGNKATERLILTDSSAATQIVTAEPVVTKSTDSLAGTTSIQEPKIQEKSQALVQPVSAAHDQSNEPGSSKPRFSVRQLMPRIGVQALGSPAGIGGGFVFDIQLTDKFNLSVGIQAQHMHTENHNELDDYNYATGQEFTDIYKNYIPVKYDRIGKISISETLLTLPVSFNYYIPLKKRWSLYVNTGTQLNLSGFQEIFYEAFAGSRESHRSFEFRTSPDLFTNFVFGSGLQWQRKNIAVQVGPYYKYVFNRDLSSSVKSAPGINASVFLNLFR